MNHPQVAIALRSHVSVLRQMNRNDEAAAIEARVKAILRLVYA